MKIVLPLLLVASFLAWLLSDNTHFRFNYLPDNWQGEENNVENTKTGETIKSRTTNLTQKELKNKLEDKYKIKKQDDIKINGQDGAYFKVRYTEKNKNYTSIIAYFLQDSQAYKLTYLGLTKKYKKHPKKILKILKSFEIYSEEPVNENTNENTNTNEPVADTQAPSFTGATSAVANSTSSITLNWTAATDDSGLSIIYNIYQAMDDIEGEDFTTPTYTTEATSYTITGLQDSTTYFFVVRAEDASSNEDINTTEVLATTKSVDTDTNSPAASSNPTLVSYESQSSTVYGLLYRPTEGSEPKPAIIYTFGGWGAQNLCSHWHDACDISTGTTNGCSSGNGDYVVLVVGMRADFYTPSGDCTGESVTSDGSESRWRGDINDALAAIEWLKTKDYVDSSRIGIFGESVGANNALLIAERSSDIKTAVVWFPHVDLEYIYNLYLSDNTINIGWVDSALGGCTPTQSDACAKEYRVRSPINYAENLTIPIQHSHCTADALVPYSVSQQLYNYMDNAGRLNSTYSFYSYDGSTDEGDGCLTNNHGPFSSNPWSGTAMTRRQDFFSSNL